MDITKTLGKPIALEDLDFGKDRLDTNKKFNRMAANFPLSRSGQLTLPLSAIGNTWSGTG
nr:hypothetical protein [Moorella glycerini]